MPITAEQKVLRRESIGSSDMAALFGLDRFKTSYDVWLEKTGQLEDTEDESAACYAGSRFEDGVLDFAEEQLGPLTRNMYMKVDNLPIAVNTDAVIKETSVPVEAKTAGLFGPVTDVWGDDGTDQVPERVIIQSHCHMMAWGQDECYVPAFIGGIGFRMYVIPRNTDIAKAIADRAIWFWDMVKKRIAPPDSIPSINVIKRVRRTPNSITDVPEELVQEWLAAKEAAKIAEQIKDEAQAKLLTALGDCEGANCGSLGAITYMQQTARKLDAESLKADHPDIFQQYYRPGKPFRVLRTRKNAL